MIQSCIEKLNLKSEEDSHILQRDIDKLYLWSKDWLMEFNKDKCKTIHYGHGNQCIRYNIDETILNSTGKENDLGVIMSSDLKPSAQCVAAANKGMSVLRQSTRTFKHINIDSFTILYKTYIRPNLEFCISAWCPYMSKDIDVMEKVQRRATRKVPELKHLKYEDRLKKLEIYHLSARRLRGDLIETYKLLNNFTDVPFERLFRKSSNDHPVISGVPQGTVLGPLLFLITISDINKDISSSKLISFADDTRIYSKITDVSDCDNLQFDLNMIYDWAITNNMFFNPQKFHYVSFNTDPTGNLCNVYVNPKMDIIPHSSNVQDLGITMSSDCTFNVHINSLSKRCKNFIGWILRTFISRDKLTMLTLFKALVLSRLDYGSQLWSPHKICQINQIEKIQRAFTKHIAGMYDLPYTKRLKMLNLNSLHRRRERYCIIYLWKILRVLFQIFLTQ